MIVTVLVSQEALIIFCENNHTILMDSISTPDPISDKVIFKLPTFSALMSTISPKVMCFMRIPASLVAPTFFVTLFAAIVTVGGFG